MSPSRLCAGAGGASSLLSHPIWSETPAPAASLLSLGLPPPLLVSPTLRPPDRPRLESLRFPWGRLPLPLPPPLISQPPTTVIPPDFDKPRPVSYSVSVFLYTCIPPCPPVYTLCLLSTLSTIQSEKLPAPPHPPPSSSVPPKFKRMHSHCHPSYPI